MAKSMGLAGLRIGWILAPAAVIQEAMQRQDYTTIGSNTLGQKIALLALGRKKRESMLARNRRLLSRNLGSLLAWIDSHRDVFTCVPPRAGAMAFLKYDLPISSEEFGRKLREKQSVFVVAGSWFGIEGYLRLGIGLEPHAFDAALAGIDSFLEEEFGKQKV